MKKMVMSSLMVGVMLMFAQTAMAEGKGAKAGGGEKANKHHAYSLVGEGVGLLGYDPVSYFPEGGGKPQKGSFEIMTQYEGVTWRFATKENLETFKKSPEKYLPAYGGWCAFGVGAENIRIEADPLNYILQNGKLLVFYRDSKVDTKTLWSKDAETMYKKAEANWPGLRK